MIKIRTLLLLMATLWLQAAHASEVMTITMDSMYKYPNRLTENWKFQEGDDSAWARPGFDDSQWKVTSSTLPWNDTTAPDIQGVCWLRFHFISDTSLNGKFLTMTLTQFGASEIYLDGKKIQEYGKIYNADTTRYYDPQELPFVFRLDSAGEHVVAVRYANFHAKRNYTFFNNSFAGFRMMMGEAEYYIAHKNLRSTVFTFVCMLLSGIFFALCLIHFFMFLYYRNQRSNLYFSLFMLSLALAFVSFFTCYASTTPAFAMTAQFLIAPIFIGSCVTLSGFINELFGKNKLRFKIIAAFAAVTLVLRFFDTRLLPILIVSLVISVSFEAVITIIIAIVRKVKGARIIGAGILFFCLLVLTFFVMGALQGQIDLNDSTVSGRILIVLLALAIVSIPVSMSLYQAWNFASISRSLSQQLEQVKILSQKSLEYEQEKQRLLETQKEDLENEVQKRTAELTNEKRKSDELLLNILPEEVAEELKQSGRTSAKTYSMVTVMFTDFKDFTDVSEKVSAELLVAEIDYCFSAFDQIVQKYKVEKIKTIGDAYICAGGMPVLNFTHPVDMVNAALDIREKGKGKQRRDSICDPYWNPYGTCSSRYRWGKEIRLRHLGRHGEPGRADGAKRRSRKSKHQRRLLRIGKKRFSMLPPRQDYSKKQRGD